MFVKSFLKRPVIVIVFIVFVLVFGLIGRSSFIRTQAEPAPPASMLVPNITATNVDAITTDVDGDGRADPGDTLEYTVTINNTAPAGAGNDALNMQFNETLDANTTLVGGSIVASPIAVNDSFSSIGNVGISVPLANGVFANDINPGGGALTVQSVNQAGLQGLLSLNSSTGAFDFTPNAGFEGSTTFTYTLANGSGFTSTATVTINVSGMIWFINASGGGPGDGRLGNPFNSIANFNALAADDPNDSIFVFENASGYSGTITLLPGQKLIGQDATATLASIAGVTVPSFSSPALPAMNSANGTVTNLTSTMTLVGTTTLRGFSVNTTTSTGISGGVVSGVTVSEVKVTTTTGTAVSLSGTGGTLSFISVSATGAANGISLSNTTGSFSVTGDGTMTAGGNSTGGTILNTTGDAIGLNGASNVTLRNMTVTNPAGHGVNADNLTGVNLFQSLTVQNFDVLNTDGITVDQTVNFTSVTLDRSLFTDAGAHGGNDGFRFVALSGNSAAGTVNVTASEFTELDGDGIQINNDGSGTINTTITGNNLHAADTTGGGNFNTLSVNLTGNGVLNATIGGAGALGNTVNDVARVAANAGALSVAALGPAALGGSDLNATIENNTITNIPNRRGINVQLEASAANHTLGHDITIKDNNIQNTVNRQGIYVAVVGITGFDNLNNDISITGNLVGTTTVVGNSARPGIHVQVFDDFATAGTALEADILLQNNQVRVNNTGDVVRIENGAGLAGNTANVETTMLGNTFTNDNAGGLGFNAEVGFFVAGTNTFSLDMNSANVAVNRNTSNRGYVLNHDKTMNAATDFNVEVQAGDPVVNTAGATYSDAQIETFFNARNTGTATTPANSNDFTGVAAVTQPLVFAAGGITDEATGNGPDQTAGSLAQVVTFIQGLAQISNEKVSLSSRLASIGNTFTRIYHGLGETVSPTVIAEETSNISYAPFSGETINVGAPTGFTLPASKSITIKFRATINNTPIGLTQVSTQGSVSGGNFATVLTDDPAVGGGADPTGTLIDSTTVTVASSQNPSITGQSVTFTATLTGAPVHGAGNPGGTVQFFDNGVAVGAPVAVVAGAVNTSTAQFVTSSLTAGNHPITATYSGGAGFNANNTSNTVNQPVSNTAVWDGSADANWNTAANWATNGVPSLATNDVSIPAAGVTNNPIISAADVTVNSLTLSAGRTLTINTNRTLNINGLLTMNGNNIDATSGLVSFSSGGTVTRTSGSILGNVDKTFGGAGTFEYPVGTATGYSPANVNVTAVVIIPSTLRVRANDGTAVSAPPINDATTLDRFWTLTETGDLTADLTFTYLQADVDGNESIYRVIRVSGGTAVGIPNGSPCPGSGSPCVDGGANTIFVGGVQNFSDWTAGELAPTAANVSIGGRVFDADGRAVLNAQLSMIDENGNTRLARTNPFGYYRFTDVPAGANYTVNVAHKLHQFTPQFISVIEDVTELNFFALP